MVQIMRRTLSVTILGFFLCLTTLLAKSSDVPLSSLTTDTSLIRIAAWRSISAGTFATDTLRADTFGPYQQTKLSVGDTRWVRLVLQNDLSTDQRRILSTPYANDEVEVYLSDDAGRSWQHERLGSHVSYWTVPYRHSNLLLPIDMKAGSHLIVLVKIPGGYFGTANPELRLIDEQMLKYDFWNQYGGRINGVYLSVFILGAVLAIFLFVAFLYIMTRDRLYLFYGLYLGGVGLYFCTKTDSLFFLGYFVSGFPKVSSLLNEPLQMIYTALYIRFSMGLLRIVDFDPRLNRFLDVFWKGLAAYAVVLTVVLGIVWSRDFEMRVLAFDRIVLLLFNVLMLARVVQKNRSPLLGYFLVGNLFFFTGVIVSTLASLEMVAAHASLLPINYFQIGVLCEIMCFSFALGYNVRIIERERNANQWAYINQLRLNRNLSEKSNRQLKEKLEKRTREVMEISDALQFQKEANLRSEFEFQLSEMEMQALRAQMNPHFIFNSLNTIRYFVLNNENDKASDYLGKFARLLRMVLQNSRQNTIPLSEELAALRLYLEIESKRFGERFEYRIEVADDLDIEGIIVPPLLLQPFAENAIWHGLLHSDRPDKALMIRIIEEADACLFVVEDNGVGREKARQMKSRSATHKKSFGMQITNKRVELFNKNFSSQIAITVHDVVDPAGEVAGTSVQIRYQLPE